MDRVAEGRRIDEMLAQSARQYGRRVALKQGRSALTYELLDGLATSLAEKLIALGLGGRHGAVFIENAPAYAIAYFAVVRAGGVVVPVPAALPPARLAREVGVCGASFVLTSARYGAMLREALSQAPAVSHLLVLQHAHADLDVEIVSLRPGAEPAAGHTGSGEEAPAVLLRTSGTAGRPKWVMLSHRNLLANISAFLDLTQLDGAEKALITLPLTSAGTHTTEMLAYLACGIPAILYSEPAFVLGEFCRTIEEERVTIANVTPFILDMMLWKGAEVAHTTTSLRKVFFASAPIAAAQFQRLLDAFPRIQFYRGYGLTEASPRCAMLLPHLARTRIDSSGQPLQGVSLRIVDEAGGERGAGEIGEVTVRGPNVMLGYYDQPADTAAVLKDGWLYTGDLGCVDAQGFVYLKGRKKNIVITHGINVCPEEVEQELMGNPNVRDACVRGVSDAHLGESLVAHVVPRNTGCLSEKELKAFLKESLEPAKVPERIVFVDHLPRNHAYKLVRDPSFTACGEIPLASEQDPVEA